MSSITRKSFQLTHYDSVVRETMIWLRTRLRVLRSGYSERNLVFYGIGNPEPRTRLGMLSELLFWVTRMALFRRLWRDEARHFEQRIIRSHVRKGYRTAFRTKIREVVRDVNRAADCAENTCIYIMNRPWGQPALTVQTLRRILRRLEDGTFGLFIRLVEIDCLYVTRRGTLVVKRAREMTPPQNDPDTEAGAHGISGEGPAGSGQSEPLRSVCLRAPSHHEVHSPSVTSLDGICELGDPEETQPPKRQKIAVPYARVDPGKLRPRYSASRAVEAEGRASTSAVELLHSKFSPVNPKI